MGRTVYVLIVGFGVGLAACISWRYHAALDAALSNHRIESRNETSIVAAGIENAFTQTYQGLRTIARMPAVRGIERYDDAIDFHGGGSGLDAGARQVIQEIYNNLASNVAMSEVYIAPVDMAPDEIDPHTGELETPIATFDELIVGRTATVHEEHGAVPQVAEIEIYEYRLMERQLAWMREMFPHIDAVVGMDFPAVGGPEVITCDNTRYSPQDPDDRDRSGLVYSVPFYGLDGRLKGCISGVILTHALRELLPTGNYALVNTGYDYVITPAQGGQWSASRAFVARAEPDPELLYSETRGLSTVDHRGRWVLWAGQPNATYWARPDVNGATDAAYAAYAGALAATAGLWLVAWLVRRNRGMLEAKNLELEQRVRHRTAELTESNQRLTEEINERKQAEEENRRLAHAIGATAEAIVVTDTTGRIMQVNPAFTKITGYARDAAVGETPRILKSGAHAPAFYVGMWETIRLGQVWSGRVINRRRDGTQYHAALTISPFPDDHGVVAGFVGVHREITKEIEHEEALASARQRAESANRAKNVFLGNISHEIRTPIMAMLGAAELAARSHPTANGDGRFDYHDTMLRNGRHLLSLIDDVLDMARLEAGRLEVHVERYSLPEIMADVEAVTAPLATRDGVRFRIVYDTEIPETIRTDPMRLKQAVINLVSNALKFTEQGHVDVHVGVERDADEPRLAICVEDTGPGIAPEALERIFETFGQLDTGPATAMRGVGLGLPLAKWIAERLGGRLDVESVVGVGSTFRLRVQTGPLDGVAWVTPAAPMVVSGSARDREDGRGATRLCGKVLLAEDFADARELIRAALEEAGAEVTSVADGRQAVDAAAEATFDLILMDNRMPVMDGVTAVRELRRRGCQTAIIAVTASTSARERARVLDAGFDDLWPKPLSLGRIVKQVGDYLETRAPDEASDTRSDDDAHPSVSLADRIAAVAAEFGASLGARVGAIRDAVDAGDNARAREMLHQLVGSAGIHGFMEIADEAARVLPLAKSGTLADRPGELDALQALVAASGCAGDADHHVATALDSEI